MEVSTITSGKLVTLQELNTSSPFFTHGNSLRVTGKLLEYSVETCMATIVEGNAKLKIDTRHLRDISFHVDSIYQFIGELHLHPDTEGVLQARVGRNVDGVDLKLYHQSLQLLRQFQAERKVAGHRQSVVCAAPFRPMTALWKLRSAVGIGIRRGT